MNPRDFFFKIVNSINIKSNSVRGIYDAEIRFWDGQVERFTIPEEMFSGIPSNISNEALSRMVVQKYSMRYNQVILQIRNDDIDIPGIDPEDIPAIDTVTASVDLSTVSPDDTVREEDDPARPHSDAWIQLDNLQNEIMDSQSRMMDVVDERFSAMIRRTNERVNERITMYGRNVSDNTINAGDIVTMEIGNPPENGGTFDHFEVRMVNDPPVLTTNPYGISDTWRLRHNPFSRIVKTVNVTFPDNERDALIEIKFHNDTSEIIKTTLKEIEEKIDGHQCSYSEAIVVLFSKTYQDRLMLDRRERPRSVFIPSTSIPLPAIGDPVRVSLPETFEEYTRQYGVPKTKKMRKYYTAETGLKRFPVREDKIFLHLGSNVIEKKQYNGCHQCFWYSLIFHRKTDQQGLKIIENDEDFEKVKNNFVKHVNKKHQKDIVMKKMKLREAAKYT